MKKLIKDFLIFIGLVKPEKEPVNEKEKEYRSPYVISSDVEDTARRVKTLIDCRIESSDRGCDFIRYDLALLGEVGNPQIFKNGIKACTAMIDELFLYIQDSDSRFADITQEKLIEDARVKCRSIMLGVFLGDDPYCKDLPVIEQSHTVSRFPDTVFIIEVWVGFTKGSDKGGISLRSSLAKRISEAEYRSVKATPFTHYHKE